MAIRLLNENPDGAKIKVVGVGGAGGNALNMMVDKGIEGVEFVAINTDSQALENNKAAVKIQIGRSLTKGLGTGMQDDIGLKAVEENYDDVERVLEGSDMVFITAGMGGGTGTGGAPAVAHIAKSLGSLVVAVVTKPFKFECRPRMRLAEDGIERLRKEVDSLIVIPNQKILTLIDKETTEKKAFELSDSVLYNAVKGISQIITKPGIINVDFADVRTIMRNMGDVMIGIGIASGEDRAEKAVKDALYNPLLDDVDISGSKSVLVNIASCQGCKMFEMEYINELIQEKSGEDAKYIFGTVADDSLEDEIMVTIIATGFNPNSATKITPIKVADILNEPVSSREHSFKSPISSEDLYKYDKPAWERRKKEREKLIKDDMSEEPRVKKYETSDDAFNVDLGEEKEIPYYMKKKKAD
jgi:cell division protein FtsZ